MILACCLLHCFIHMNMELNPKKFTSIVEDGVLVGEELINVVGTIEPSNEWTQWQMCLQNKCLLIGEIGVGIKDQVV